MTADQIEVMLQMGQRRHEDMQPVRAASTQIAVCGTLTSRVSAAVVTPTACSFDFRVRQSSAGRAGCSDA